MIAGPLTLNGQTTNVDTIYNNGEWNTSPLSFSVPHNIMNLITSTFIPTNLIKDDKMI